MALVTASAHQIEVAADHGEADLMARARDKDPEAWDILYSTHYRAIYRYAYLRVSNVHTAEDLAADVFLQTVRSIGRYRYRGIAFRAWLYRITHNLTADHCRRARTRPGPESLREEPVIGAVRDIAGQVAAWSDLRTAVRELTEQQQQVVLLRFVEGLSLAEVAEATGKSQGAIKAMQHRAVVRLRKLLDGEVR